MLNCVLPTRIGTCWRLHTLKCDLLRQRKALYSLNGLHLTSQRCSRKHKDLYKILGVSQSSSGKEIKAAYIELVKKHHPDASGIGSTDADSKSFHDIRDAYETLSDSHKKQKYDMFNNEGAYQRRQTVRTRHTANMRDWNSDSRVNMHRHHRKSQRNEAPEDVYESAKKVDNTPYTSQEYMTFTYCTIVGLFSFYVMLNYFF